MYGRRRDILLGNPEKIKAYIQEILTNSSPEEQKNIQDKLDNADAGYMDALRRVILQTTDMFWVEHLEVMDYMRSSVNLRAYGQRDPLIEYKKEGLKLFKDMEFSIGQEILKIIPQIVPNQNFFNEPVKMVETREDAKDLTKESVPVVEKERGPSGEKVGRNDPCPCGSGKKYKACGLIGTEEHNRLVAQK